MTSTGNPPKAAGPLFPSQLKNKEGTFAARVDALRSTPVSQRPKKRLVELKVLVLGLCRTGTTSVREALFQLGYYDVSHMHSLHGPPNGEVQAWAKALERKEKGLEPMSSEEWHQLLGYCEALTDVPPAVFVEELISLYPDAKVILTTRDSPQAWYKSVLETIYHQRKTTFWLQDGLIPSILQRLLPVPPIAAMLKPMITAICGPGTAFEDPEYGKRRYIEHSQLVKRSKGAGEVLEFNVKQGWGPLCEFLGVEAPDTPFPRMNDTAEFLGRIDAVRKNRPSLAAEVGKAVIIQALKVAPVVAAGVFLWRRYGRR